MELLIEKQDGYCIVHSYTGNEAHIEIPSYYENLPVMEIAPNTFQSNSEMQTVKIPMHLQKIGNGAFQNCRSLSCICVTEEAGEHSVLPPALYRIGDYALAGTNLKKVTFTSPYLELGRYAFHESSVEDVWFRDAIKVTLNDGVFSCCHNLEFVSYFDIGIDDGLPMHAFEHCGKLRKILADHLVGGIGAGCFYDCYELEELPIRRTLNFVCEEDFSGFKKLNTNGFYRTMRDALNGIGDSSLMNEVLQQKAAYCTWGPTQHRAEYAKRIENLGKEILRKIHSTPRTQQSSMVLIKAVGSEYFNPSDGWDFVERFYLFRKTDILLRFKHIADFDITCEWSLPELRPPMRSFDNLTQEEVLRLLMFENGPKPRPYNLEQDLGLLLDGELAGDAADYQRTLTSDFLTRLIDYKLHPTWTDDCYDISNEQLAHEISPDNHSYTQEEIFHRLKWDILFNRINLYRELRKASFQIASDLFNQRRR